MTTEKNKQSQSWCSGDWKTTPSKNVPYNGIEITGAPLYDENGRFVSADIVVSDCTYDKKGVKSEIIALTVKNGWLPIPNVVKPGSPPVDDPKFTVKGKLKLRHGSSDILLRINFAYGLDNQRHKEIGIVFGFPTTIDVETEKGETKSV